MSLVGPAVNLLFMLGVWALGIYVGYIIIKTAVRNATAEIVREL